MCVPLGPKTDLSTDDKLPTLIPPPRSPPFLSVSRAQPIPLELVGRARVVLQLFATFETRAHWLWHFKAISNRSGLGRFTHAPLRSHSRTHARTHAGLSRLIAPGQWLAMLSVTQPSLSTVPTPTPPHFPLLLQCRPGGGCLLRVCTVSAGVRVLEWGWPVSLRRGRWESLGPPPGVLVSKAHIHTQHTPLNWGANVLGHRKLEEKPTRLEGGRGFNLKGLLRTALPFQKRLLEPVI